MSVYLLKEFTYPFYFFKLEDVEETISERLLGLTEMLPDPVWIFLGRSVGLSYWLLRRTGWVVGTSLALLALPPFLEHQRIDFEEMQNMQKKQVRWPSTHYIIH